ncbi:MAG: hypothetical protein IT383_17200 [Deltaproteobacteria bacterium]|nr:hypothetical protein [Deltaproteobacteria bacterium]
MSPLMLALALAAAPDGSPSIIALTVEGDVRVELSVGAARAPEVIGADVEVRGPSAGTLIVLAPARARASRPVVRVRVEGPALAVTLARGAQLQAAPGRLDALRLEVRHTSRADTTAIAAKALDLTVSEAGRVRARGEVVTVRAERSAQVTLVGKPKKLAQDVRDAARLTVE